MERQAPQTLDPSRTVTLATLVEVAPQAIVSRTLMRASGGSVTLFAFDAGQELSEHTAPFDALVTVLEGSLQIRIGGEPHSVEAGGAIVMPAGIPHGLRAQRPSIMMLVMLRAASTAS